MANYYGYGVSGMALNGTLRRGVIWAPVHMNRTSQASRDNTPQWDKYQLGFMIWKEFISLPWDSVRKYWSECILANENAP